MVANAKTTSAPWSFPSSLEIWIREANSAAFLHYLVFIWTKHCKAIGPPKKNCTKHQQLILTAAHVHTSCFLQFIECWCIRLFLSLFSLAADFWEYKDCASSKPVEFQPQVEKSPSARASPAEYARIERPKYFHEESRAAISYCMRSMLILEVDRHRWHSADFPNYFRNIITSPSSFYSAFVCGEEKLSPLSPLLLDLILVDTRFNARMVLQRFRVPLQSGSGVFWVTRWAQFFGPFSSVWPQCQLEIWKIAWNTTRWFLLTNLNHI